MNYELLTINGETLLNQTAQTPAHVIPVLSDFFDTVLNRGYYPCNPLMDQLKEQLAIADNDAHRLRDVWIYVDFKSCFAHKQLNRDAFDRVFNEGFMFAFADSAAPIHFVPLLSSASRNKECVYGFIRKDLFASFRSRLDLDFPLSEKSWSLADTAKLYSYRALCCSNATPVLRAADPEGASFFTPDNIIMIPDYEERHLGEVLVYTADQTAGDRPGEVTLIPTEAKKRKVKITCFDGEGLITPRGRQLLCRYLPDDMHGRSFQIRMPFLKGMLHTVDFHQFLRDHGVTGQHAYILDAFGERRDLLAADIVIPVSMFKLWKFCDQTPADIERYFEGIRRYNYGLYVVMTERQFHNTQYASLNSQLLSTLDLSAEALDALVHEHCELADSYCAENLLDPDKRIDLHVLAERNHLTRLLLDEPAFLRDDHIAGMLRHRRVAAYNDLALGHIRVKGENRFLSGDLMKFMFDLMDRLIDSAVSVNPKKKSRLLYKGCVYLPGKTGAAREVALLRNPHLSRHEDVYAKTKDAGYLYYYEKYLGQLTGVVFVGHRSYIPAAMGGADFDGDQIIVCYDPRIIDACKRSGFTEDETPFVNIPALEGSQLLERIGPYVSPQVVYNTFSNRIGRISNAAMKIAAVEYDAALPPCDETPRTAFCTILTGTEIDAAKKGLRPDIDKVVDYDGREHETHRAVVADIQQFIRQKDTLESWGVKKPVSEVDENGRLVWHGEILSPNRRHNPVTQLLYRWVRAFDGFAETEMPPIPDEIPLLDDIFDAENPCEQTTGKILTAYARAMRTYASAKRRLANYQKTCAESDAKIVVRLRGQYDLPVAEFNWKRAARLKADLLGVIDRYSLDEIKALHRALFSEKETQFDAETYWPYGTSLTDHPLLRDILSLRDADLLTEFRFEGYRLLYYFLTSAIAFKETERDEKEPRDTYAQRYVCAANDAFVNRISAADFKKLLIDMTRRDLFEALGCDRPDDAIRRLYPPKSAAQRQAFWDIFTAHEVLDARGGDGHAG